MPGGGSKEDCGSVGFFLEDAEAVCWGDRLILDENLLFGFLGLSSCLVGLKTGTEGFSLEETSGISVGTS